MTGSDDAVIRVGSLGYTYPGGDEPAVRDLSFEVRPGEVFGFLGPSGAGKSTTQKILIGLISGWRGHVEVLGRLLEEWDGSYYREIGVSFELPNHYRKLTVRENLELFRTLHGARADGVAAVLRRVGLEDAIDVRAGRLSKGMQHRLTFARSLLHRPRLWFLDEPTAGLDPANARRIVEIVEERREQGVTAFLTTHDMWVADRLCDRVAFIVDGRVEVIDSPATLRHRYGRREVLVTWEGDGRPGSATFPLDVLRVSPMTVREYLASKVVTLSGFAAVEAAVVYAIASPGAPASVAPLAAGVLVLGVSMTLLGVGQAASYDSVTSFLLPGRRHVGLPEP